jgi:hypothetical protein
MNYLDRGIYFKINERKPEVGQDMIFSFYLPLKFKGGTGSPEREPLQLLMSRRKKDSGTGVFDYEKNFI